MITGFTAQKTENLSNEVITPYSFEVIFFHILFSVLDNHKYVPIQLIFLNSKPTMKIQFVISVSMHMFLYYWVQDLCKFWQWSSITCYDK